MRVALTSVLPVDLATVAGAHGVGRAVVVPTAADGLADRDDIVGPVIAAAGGLAAEVDVLDLATASADDVDERVGAAEVIVVGGGDPFALLTAIQRTGFDRAVREAVARGTTYVGISAGATTAGPTLAPLVDVSPFDPPTGLGMGAMAVVPVLVLPHDDRPGRRALHARALRRWGRDTSMLALADDEHLIVGDDGWRLVRSDRTALRPARPTDASGIAATFTAAGRAEWSAFLGVERMADLEPPVDAWADRIDGGGSDHLVVAEIAGRIAGVVWVRPPIEGTESGEGEVAALYTHPETWGRGLGRRLLDLGLDQLRAHGCDEAVLFTEERNARPRRVYERAGWRTDGTIRERPFLGAPLREVRYRLAL
ncbi:MAG TPA: GNAT family N-acetyltransferase [Acidimicrobiales bacterium]|nr:GNAT family N-acetyltransferase [Acidimicrobiales bacterium]